MYGASKAALTLMSETLRLEMAPLGVRVITLMTGGVATKFLSNRETVSLPQESYYHAVKHIIEHQSSEVPMAVSQESFASEVLKVRNPLHQRACSYTPETWRYCPATEAFVTLLKYTFGR